jgi:hypothetical protein
MRIHTIRGAKYVKRYRKGHCFAAVFSGDTNDRQVASAMAQGEAAFFPFNETTGQFDWAKGTGKPLRFKR